MIIYIFLKDDVFFHNQSISFWLLGTTGRGGIAVKFGGGAQGQRERDCPAGGGCPETAGQPVQTP